MIIVSFCYVYDFERSVLFSFYAYFSKGIASAALTKYRSTDTKYYQFSKERNPWFTGFVDHLKAYCQHKYAEINFASDCDARGVTFTDVGARCVALLHIENRLVINVFV